MNHAGARKLDDGSGWHFTVRNDDRIWTHECCREQVPATEEDVARTDWIYHGTLKVGDLIAGPAHAAHATQEEAEECFHQWRLRQPIDYREKLFDNWNGCEALVDEHTRCDQPTKGGAQVNDLAGSRYHLLCDAHRTDEVVHALLGRVTEAHYS